MLADHQGPWASCWVTDQFLGIVHRMTPNDLDMFKVKNTIMDATYTPKAQFSFILLYDELFLSYGPILGKMHQMTLTWTFKVKNINMHARYTPGPIFSSISLYDEPFSSYGPIFGKLHRMTPNDLDVLTLKIPTFILHTPRVSNFYPFRSTISRFELRPNF